MYDLSGDVAKLIDSMKAGDKTSYDKLVARVASHTFGDNVGSYVSSYSLSSGDGVWKLIVADLGYDGNWLTANAYLIPEGFEISE